MKISFAEGTICRYLQAAYFVMIVDPNFSIKWAAKTHLSPLNEFINGLFKNTLFAAEVE
jgi:hypothetical protein